MIDVRELRIGNYVYDIGGKILRIDFFEHLQSGFDCKFGQRMLIGNEEVHPMTDYTDSAKPIPLTEQWLIDFGLRHNPIVLISRQYLLDIGRDRMLSFSDVGTPNFMVWLQSVEGNKVTDLVCLHNWDYDKEMSVHQLQNLYFTLTGQELTKK